MRRLGRIGKMDGGYVVDHLYLVSSPSTSEWPTRENMS